MKIYHPSFVITVIIVALFGFMNVHARAIQQKSANHADEEKIREVIQNYFDRRYGSRAVNQIGDFRELTDGSLQANSFLKSETDKLEIVIYNAKLHHLGYLQYKYTLDFNDITIDKENQSATVSLSEGHDVIFEISAMIFKAEPIVSKMRNLNHTIVLNRTQYG